ncbi:MAG: amino acid ABC transporter ATP-binding protein [Lachnospiraceae bacterium]|nr:amino acid ABC transporter ATP-binding protein [Lachnospiraceae bacterium]
MIEIKGLKKRFKKLHVLNGVDLTIPDGSVVGIIGASGSGKSTLLRCIDYLEKPDHGHIRFDDVDFDVEKASKEDIRYMRTHTTMVFQSFNLFKYKTALENVMEGLIVVQKMEKEKAKELAEHYLEKVGLKDRANHYPNQLSGGQQQRVAIARSLALNPKVILFDEPTSALDPEMIQEVLKVIQDVAKEGKTMVIVSHEMNFIYDICDKVVFLENGNILASGTPQEVLVETKNERIRQFVSKVNFVDQYYI